MTHISYDETCKVCGKEFTTKPIVTEKDYFPPNNHPDGRDKVFRSSICGECRFQWWEDMARKIDPTLESGQVMIEYYSLVVTPLYGIV